MNEMNEWFSISDCPYPVSVVPVAILPTDGLPMDVAAVIEAAVLAEREDCARIAGIAGQGVGEVIAALIRAKGVA